MIASGNTVNSLCKAAAFSTCTGIVFQNNTLNLPGLNGIVIMLQFYPAPTDSAAITDNTVTGLSTSDTAFVNMSSGSKATLNGNNW